MSYLAQAHQTKGNITGVLTACMALSQQMFVLQQRLKTDFCTMQQEEGVASSKATKASLILQASNLICRGIENMICGALQGAALVGSKVYSNFSAGGKTADKYEEVVRNNDAALEKIAARQDQIRSGEVDPNIAARRQQVEGLDVSRLIDERLSKGCFDRPMTAAPTDKDPEAKLARWNRGDFRDEELVGFLETADEAAALHDKIQTRRTGNQNIASTQRQTVQARESLIDKIVSDMGKQATMAVSNGTQASLTWSQGTHDAIKTLADLLTSMAKSSTDQIDGISQQAISALNQAVQELQTWIATSQRPV